MELGYIEVPNLTSFGALIRHAVTLEELAIEFYERSASITPGDRGSVFLKLAKNHRQRKQLLEKVRREMICEMVLEPIEGLNGGDYVPTPADAALEAQDFATRIEGLSRKFYADSAVVAWSVLAEASKVFERLARENGDHLKLL